jgi:hypothetical protein
MKVTGPMRILSVLLGLSWLVAACGSGRSCQIHASDYTQSCTADSDCAAVFETNTCGGMCACPNAAINRSSLAQYQSDLARQVAPLNVCDCANIGVHCVSTVCTYVAP